MSNLSETIFSLSCGHGGALYIVRISGPRAMEAFLLTNLYEQKIQHRTACVCNFHNSKKEIIDEIIITAFLGTQTFTGENVVEICCHGSRYILEQIYTELISSCGFCIAQPGEFAMRAFLNGKIDLIQAEGIDSIIKSENKLQHQLALQMLEGKTSSIYKDWRNLILEIMSMLEVQIDFSDEDIPKQDMERAQKTIAELRHQIELQLARKKSCNIIQNGIKIAIIGEPNVGKSSILNLLSGRDLAIVTNIPGTTRDCIEAELQIANIKVTVVDTAGIRDTTDAIELEGIRRSKMQMEKSDFNIIVCDEPNKLSTLTIQPNDILVLNKCDIITDSVAAKQEILQQFPRNTLVAISALKDNNPDQLITAMESKIIATLDMTESNPAVINVRQYEILYLTLQNIDLIDFNEPIEILCERLRQIVNLLSKIIGAITTDDILGNIFSKFCIGK